MNTKPERYSLASFCGQFTMIGWRTKGFIIESFDKNYCIDHPTLIKCDSIPNNRQEIPTNEIAQTHPYLQSIEQMIPHLDKDAEILLLIGRDAVEANHVLEQRLSHNQLSAQRLKMGCVIVGETCLDGAHYPSTVTNAMKTFVLPDGRPFEPYDNSVHISEKLSTSLFK